MPLVLARSEVDRREVLRGNLAVNRHGESRSHKWARGAGVNLGGAGARRATPGHQGPFPFLILLAR